MRTAILTEELQANGHYKEAIDFSSGVFYLHERFYVQRDGYSRENAVETDPDVNSMTTTPLSARAKYNITTTDSLAFFEGEANLKVTDWATLTGGLRETIEWKTFDFDNKELGRQRKRYRSIDPGQRERTLGGADAQGLRRVSIWPECPSLPDVLPQAFQVGRFRHRSNQLDVG